MCLCFRHSQFCCTTVASDWLRKLRLGELSHFVYCLLQKIKQSGALPVMEKWESYKPPKNSSLAPIERSACLRGFASTLPWRKPAIYHLKNELEGSARRFFEFLRNALALCCRPPPRAWIWVKVLAVSVPWSISGAMAVLPSFCLDSFWTIWLHVDGKEGRTRRPVKPNFNRLCGSSASWSANILGSTLMLATSWHIWHSTVDFAAVVIYTRWVLFEFGMFLSCGQWSLLYGSDVPIDKFVLRSPVADIPEI